MLRECVEGVLMSQCGKVWVKPHMGQHLMHLV